MATLLGDSEPVGERDDDSPEAPDEKRDRDRERILARRKFFIASAVAGMTMSSCDKAQPCLNVAAPVQDSGSPPRPCLKVAPQATAVQDAGAPSPAPAASSAAPAPTAERDAKAPPAPPRPCLKVAPQKPKDDDKPRPCLRVASPPKKPPGEGSR